MKLANNDLSLAVKGNIPNLSNDFYYTFVGEKDDTPKKGKKNIFRSSVLVILQNFEGNNLLCLNSKKRDYISFITGGIEDGENVIQASKRETIEETGYFDFQSIYDFKFSILNYFYAKNSDVNKLVKYNIVFLKLASLKNKRH